MTSDPPESSWSRPEVVLYLASASNHFMAEIARLFQEGFRAMGVEASLAIDEVPGSAGETGPVAVVVAPHEFLSLFLERKLGSRAWKAVARECYCLNTEQPGSGWFEAAWRFARRSKGVFDINRQGVAEFHRRGVLVAYTPLGYGPSLEEVGSREPGAGSREHFNLPSPLAGEGSGVRGLELGALPSPLSPCGRGVGGEGAEAGNDRGLEVFDSRSAKDIDILFLGHYSPRRGAFLTRHAERLQRYRCALILPDADQPRLASSPGSLAGMERNRLLRRAKVLVNVHSSDRRYFEWHRAMVCMANRCVLVSEVSEAAEPLTDGEQLLFADLDHLMGRCQELLDDEPRRRRMADRAYEFLREGLPIEPSCRQIMELTLSRFDSKSDSQGSGFRVQDTGVAMRWRRGMGVIRAAAFQVRRVAREYPSYLRRQRLAHLVYYPAQSFADRLRGRWSLADIERRRREILDRLGGPDGPCSHADRNDYELLVNGAYERGAASGGPAVSVIVTVYNYARFVGECLRSVAGASAEGMPGGFELVVVDDASTDGSACVAEAHLRELSLSACLVRKRWNTGVADARNLGVRLARAPYVFVLDADNTIYPRCLARLYQAIAASRAAAAYGPIRKFDSRTQRALGLLSYQAWDVRRLLTGPYIDTMAMFDRQTLLAVGGYSTELIRFGWFGWEDYDLWLKLAQAGHAGQFCPEIVASYRVHASPMNRITLHYKPRLARYFEEKFAGLLARHPAGRLRFGYVALR